jgi:FdhD protein
MAHPCRPIDVIRIGATGAVRGSDVAATEEPLEIRIDDEPFAVLMRTPGADIDLTAGFLLSERLIHAFDDLGTIAHCAGAEPDTPDNVVNVTLTSDEHRRVVRDRRRTVTSASCGVCGRATIESLRVDVPPLHVRWTVTRNLVSSLTGLLREAQTIFDETGGLHGAALVDRQSQVLAVAEDVGRHNAVDKVVGHMLLAERLPLEDAILVVSGRTSYEIVQKACVARVPMVVAVSAPSTLAIELADAFGITLVGFARSAGFNVYAHPGRIG